MAIPKLARLLKKTQLGSDTWMYSFAFVGDEPLGFIGGQYIILNSGLKDPEGNDIKRAYTLFSRDDEQRTFAICVKRIGTGPVSSYLPTLELGTELLFSGPWGKFIKNPEWPKEGNTFLIATDTGITTLLGLLNSEKFRNRLSTCHAIWFVTGADDFIPFSDVTMQLPKGDLSFETFLIAPIGEEDRVEEAVKTVEAKIKSLGVPINALLTGDGLILRPVQELLEKVGVHSDQIGAEPFFNKQKVGEAGTPIPGLMKSGATGKLMAVKDMREGFTTGACSAAAAKAATRILIHGKLLSEIETTLPNRRKVTFVLKRSEVNGESAICSIIKDAGDDPDATHGAELTAQVRLLPEKGVVIRGGEGVAVVTKAGLGLEVGGPAINPMPRKNITEMVMEELENSEYPGAEVTISVPTGREISKKTLNARLGLLGGISILGTTGIVKPYSTAAYRASVIQGIKIAHEQGRDIVVLTTGGKSEKYAMDLFPSLDVISFIQVGDFIGTAIKAAARATVKHAVVVGMIGKLSKMADGRMMTHAVGSEVNMKMLEEIARGIGASEELCAQILKANTARHVLELCQTAGISGITPAICKKVVEVLATYSGNLVAVSCYLVDFEGALLGQFEMFRPEQIPSLSPVHQLEGVTP
jgi:cobalt-precorrin-5B (C1)-methyltransferase